MKYLILSFDGGGARVLLEWTLTKRILEAVPQLLPSVTVFAGTSAGSILAAGLASGKGMIMDQIVTPLTVQQIFYRTNYHKVTSLNGLTSSKYGRTQFSQVLDNHFGTLSIGDVPRALFVPSFDVRGGKRTEDSKVLKSEDFAFQRTASESDPDWLRMRCRRWHPVYFHNLTPGNQVHDKESNLLVRDAILRSGAAPYYFPVCDGYIDGGVVCNNPSMAVLTRLLKLGVALNDIHILSIGSGEKPTRLPDADNDAWGLLHWAPDLLDILFDGSQEVVAQQCFDLLGDRFHRVMPILTHTIPLDGAISTQELIDIGNAMDLTHTIEWCKTLLDVE